MGYSRGGFSPVLFLTIMDSSHQPWGCGRLFHTFLTGISAYLGFQKGVF